MARKRNKATRMPRPNPYRNLDDRQLDAAYREAVEAYADRLEYFGALPAFLHDDFKLIHEQGPEAWGLTGSEWDEYVLDLRDHVVACDGLDDMRSERHRRLSDAARQAVESCADLDAAQAKRALFGIPQGPVCPWKTDEESMSGYFLRIEGRFDAWAESAGADSGLGAVLESLMGQRTGRTPQGCIRL